MTNIYVVYKRLECFVGCVGIRKITRLITRISKMYQHTRNDRIKIENIRSKVGVTIIEDKIRENQLRWFGHTTIRQRFRAKRIEEFLGSIGKRL
ncbi:hypothetical protein DVH24_011502 [Malus domestica]|uniref:Uncharacterized protein n=1 Tax=Malus domestica TaxID=3750 RepID=A0A498JW48_MALDO|nr:hypothetical protein DVH24_011502 [Malus domestica]